MRAAGIAGTPGMEEPYERLKELTRGRRVDGPALRAFIAGLGLPGDVQQRLSELTPGRYTGLAAELVDRLGRGPRGVLGRSPGRVRRRRLRRRVSPRVVGAKAPRPRPF